MLRASAQKTERNVDLSMINGNAEAPSEMAFGRELTHFAEAVARTLCGDQAGELKQARQALLDAAGSRVLVDAAGVAGNFQRMVRIADSMGIPVDALDNPMQNEIREELDLYRFRSAENSAA